MPFTLSKQRKKQNQWLSVLLRFPRSKFYNLHQRSVSWGKAPKRRAKKVKKKKRCERKRKNSSLSRSLLWLCLSLRSKHVKGFGSKERQRNGIFVVLPALFFALSLFPDPMETLATQASCTKIYIFSRTVFRTAVLLTERVVGAANFMDRPG